MNKRDFIQACSIQLFPYVNYDPDQAIHWAERLWDGLSAKGYGASEPRGPNENDDWYKKLTPEQRRSFDKFWTAFNHKVGRNGAAMRWHQINPDPALAEVIIKAAAKEAAHQREPGQVRKMAQGWLQERRFEDQAHTETQRAQIDPRIEQLRHLNSELRTLEMLDQGTGKLAEQIAAIRAKLRECQTPSRQ